MNETQSQAPKARRRFSVLLPSDPVPLPFGGSFEGLSAQYDQDRVMGLPEHLLEITGELQDALEAVRREQMQARLEHTKTWGAYERATFARARDEEIDSESLEDQVARLSQSQEYNKALVEYTRGLNKRSSAMRDLRRQIDLAVIAHTMLRMGKAESKKDEEGHRIIEWSWPFEDMEAPNPQDPASFADWPSAVIEWLANGALDLVRKQLENPNSVA